MLRSQRFVPGMLIELRAKMKGGARGSHPLAVLAIFRVQKYET